MNREDGNLFGKVYTLVVLSESEKIIILKLLHEMFRCSVNARYNDGLLLCRKDYNFEKKKKKMETKKWP